MGIFRKNNRDSAATLNNEPGYNPAGMTHTTTATHVSPRDAGNAQPKSSGGFFHRSTPSNDSTQSNEMRDMGGYNNVGVGAGGINEYEDGMSHNSGRSGGLFGRNRSSDSDGYNGNGMGLGNAGTGGTTINFSLEQAKNKLARAQEHERVADSALAQSRASVREARQEISALEREARLNLDQATKMKKAGSKLGKY